MFITDALIYIRLTPAGAVCLKNMKMEPGTHQSFKDSKLTTEGLYNFE